ncbi:MAG: hypothetical protein M1823_008570, partial [Watsoniomyces obsoletus]
MACHHALDSFDPMSPNVDPEEYYGYDPKNPNKPLNFSKNDGPLSEELQKIQADSRRSVKVFAKRALKDYLSFLSRFEYAPRLPIKVAKDFNERVSIAAHGSRNHRLQDSGPPEPYTV